MKFIISSTTLLKNVQAISGVLVSNSTLPILDDFLFELTDESLKITASDQETTMVVTVKPEEIAEQGRIAIPAKLLIDWLKTLPDIPVSFAIDTENYSIHITSGEGKFNLSGHDPDEYPLLPEITDTQSFTLNSDLLLTGIAKTLFATGNDELRPAMSGVFCEVQPEKITFVSTDAHKLVRYIRTDFKSDTEVSFILPKKALTQIKAALSTSNVEDVTISYTDKNIVFEMGHVVLTCVQIEGRFPNYNAVIPTDNPNILTVDRILLMNTLKRVSVFASQATHLTRLSISGQSLTVMADDIDYSNDGRERITCNYDGADMDIGFSAKFLIDMLNNIDNDTIRMELSQPNRAGIIFPVEKSNENEDILMLIMPIMLNS
ncbi:MAG: DNA polymerase III subunit beta [Bacteroidales bacterium]|nr:DNA polymerase III subunit beta [Bacteroidales bacterium]